MIVDGKVRLLSDWRPPSPPHSTPGHYLYEGMQVPPVVEPLFMPGRESPYTARQHPRSELFRPTTTSDDIRPPPPSPPRQTTLPPLQRTLLQDLSQREAAAQHTIICQHFDHDHGQGPQCFLHEAIMTCCAHAVLVQCDAFPSADSRACQEKWSEMIVFSTQQEIADYINVCTVLCILTRCAS